MKASDVATFAAFKAQQRGRRQATADRRLTRMLHAELAYLGYDLPTVTDAGILDAQKRYALAELMDAHVPRKRPVWRSPIKAAA